MPFKKLPFAFMAGGVVILGAVLWLWSAQPASAQCGSQASSCKNCHETQGQDPVNTVGDWHTQHAFIDACVVCHAGNDQASDKDAAHTGLAAPLADVQASCSRCHPSDTLEKAKVYAVALGMEAGTGGGAASGGDSAPAPTAVPPADSGGSTVVVEDPNVIDYAQLYDQTVGGKAPINWGNVIIGVLFAALVAGGVGFVLWNERRVKKTSKSEAPTSQVGERSSAATQPPMRPEVAVLLPILQSLEPRVLAALKTILNEPGDGAELLVILARLDFELIEKVRRLDRRELRLLIALAEGQ